MSFVGALLRSTSPENPNMSLNSSAFYDFIGGGRAAGVAVTERSVYGLTAWYRAIALIAGTAAALPIHTFKNQTRERAPKYVLAQPSRSATPFEFWQAMYANALSWGTSYARKTRDRGGIVVRLSVIHPSRCQVITIDETDENPAGKLFRVTDWRGRTEVLTPYEVFELPYLSIDGQIGLRPLEIFRETLGSGIASERTGAQFWENGAQLSGVLETDKDLNETQATNTLRGFRTAYTGPKNAGKVALLDNGAKYKTIALPPQDAQLIESRKFTVTEIARLFGIPPHMLGDVEKSSSWGTGIEQQMIGFVQFTLLPWLRLVEQRITLDLLPGGWTAGRFYAEYSVEGLLRGDSAARSAFYHSAVIDGWMNRNEVRSKENLEPVDGLDEFLVPSNLTLVSIDGQMVPLGGSNAGDAIAA